jgi:2-iminobutanoate/2-iminopropanoate deaminase
LIVAGPTWPGTEQTWTFKLGGDRLKSAGMGLSDIVKVDVFLTDSRFIAPYRATRDRYFPKAPFSWLDPADRAGLANPGMLVEVEVVAAK